MIKFETNAAQAVAAVAGVSERIIRKTFAHSANSTILSSRTFLLRALTEQGLKRKYGAAALNVGKATPDTLRATLSDQGRKIPLSAFSPRTKRVKTARGMRTGVTALLGGNRELVPGAFLAETKSGHVGIFQRVGAARLPIKELFATRIMQIVGSVDGLESSVKDFANSLFPINFARDLEYYKGKERMK